MISFLAGSLYSIHDLMIPFFSGVAPPQNNNKEKQRSIRHKLVSLTLKRKNKMGDEIKKKLQEEEYTADSYNSWLESRHSDPK